jgi:membrane-bound lytic murein transglycosylase D
MLKKLGDHWPSQPVDMRTVRTIPLILSCLLAFGCAATRTYTSTTEIQPHDSVRLAIAKPIKIASNTEALEPSRIEPRPEEGKGPTASNAGALVQEKRAEQGPLVKMDRDQPSRIGQKVSSKKADDTKPPLTSRELAGQEQQSTFLARDDSVEEGDISSVLSADYLLQFDIPIVFNDAVQYFVRYFTTEKRKVFGNWLRRSRRYVPMIKEILREQGLPEDLIYLAMIESGFNPKAYSSMKACGPWQFIYETGGRYGLKVTHWVDERRDPEKSTVAAALYLKDLFNQFGNWYLAAAGYNAGEKRIERAVERHETTDFWEITKYNTLPKETREYIPRLLAAAIVAKEPERFGFTDIDYDMPIRFINERVPGGTAMAAIARAASTDLVTVRSLNPEILTGVTPPNVDNYVVKLPESVKRERFLEELGALLERERRLQDATTYVCKRRDNLPSIAKKYGIKQEDVILVNSCDEGLSIKQGHVIFIPKFYKNSDHDDTDLVGTARAPLQARETREANNRSQARPVKKSRDPKPSDKETVRANYHIVRKGESLASISLKYGIESTQLRQINKLNKTHIYPNMRLQLTGHKAVGEKQARPAFHHVVKKGETLSGIAGRYDMDMQTLKEMNRLKKSNIWPGMKLKVSAGTTSRPAAQG